MGIIIIYSTILLFTALLGATIYDTCKVLHEVELSR